MNGSDDDDGEGKGKKEKLSDVDNRIAIVRLRYLVK
jgi:hypothetical protein